MQQEYARMVMQQQQQMQAAMMQHQFVAQQQKLGVAAVAAAAAAARQQQHTMSHANEDADDEQTGEGRPHPAKCARQQRSCLPGAAVLHTQPTH
jgi:hypothetical protein